MSSALGKRLGKLEASREQETAAHVEAALDVFPSAAFPDLLRELETRGKPGHNAALERLMNWGKSVPEVADSPNLSPEAQKWHDRANRPGARYFLPPASGEVVSEFIRHSRQWAEIAARPDCPEPEAAKGQAAGWQWWAELARVAGRESGEV